MKLISLTQEKFTKVDDEDYEYLMQWKWYANKYKNGWYAQRKAITEKGSKEYKTISMHRVILKLSKLDKMVDHINFDGLDNQKSNLRLADASQNQANRKPKENKSSLYKGVSLVVFKEETYKYWRAVLKHKGIKKSLGNFPFTPEGEIEAAKAYDEAAKIYHGEFAYLNFKK